MINIGKMDCSYYKFEIENLLKKVCYFEKYCEVKNGGKSSGLCLEYYCYLWNSYRFLFFTYKFSYQCDVLIKDSILLSLLEKISMTLFSIEKMVKVDTKFYNIEFLGNESCLSERYNDLLIKYIDNMNSFSSIGNDVEKCKNENIILAKEILLERFIHAKNNHFKSYLDYRFSQGVCFHKDEIVLFLNDIYLFLKNPMLKLKEKIVSYYEIKNNRRFEISSLDSAKNDYKNEILNINGKSFVFYLHDFLESIFLTMKDIHHIDFIKNEKNEKYHSSMQWYDVFRESFFLGSVCLDLFARSGKKSGTWFNLFLQGGKTDKKDIKPLCLISSCLTQDEIDIKTIRNLSHEFGHAIHALFSSQNKIAYSFPNIPSEFLETPAFFYEKVFIDCFLKDNNNQDIILNLIHFDRLFVLWNQLELSFLDIDFHGEIINEKSILDIEKDLKYKMNLFLECGFEFKTRAHSLSLIFGGKYEASFYTYIIAEFVSILFYKKLEGNKDFFKYMESILFEGKNINLSSVLSFLNSSLTDISAFKSYWEHYFDAL